MESNQINEIVEKHTKEQTSSEETKTGENSNGGEGQQQAPAQTEEEINKANADAEKEALKAEAISRFLKEVGVDSVDALKEKLKDTGKGELTPEQKKKAEELYESQLQNFAVEKDLMKLDEFSQLKTLKSKQDADLVFDKFLTDWKEENPDIKVEEGSMTEADIIKAAREEFENEYKLNHSNEKVKARGVSRLASDAAAIRNPLESSYNNVKEAFDNETDLRSNYPKFAESVKGIATELVPEKFEWFKGKDGDNEVPVEIDLPEDDRKEIHDKVVKRLSTAESYQLFREGKIEELKERVTDYVDYLVTKKSKDIGNSKIAEIFLGRGIEKGSTTGANNSFATQQAKGSANSSDKTSKAENEQAILEQFGKK